jgi:hypothetical protein
MEKARHSGDFAKKRANSKERASFDKRTLPSFNGSFRRI